jgi:hypothetical protein
MPNHTKNPSPVKENQPAGEPITRGLKQKKPPRARQDGFFLKTVTVQQCRSCEEEACEVC